MRGVEIHLLVDPGSLSRDRLEVTGDAFRHLFRARRLESGQRLRVVDGAGGARWAVVEEVSRGSARIALLDGAPAHDPDVRVEVAVAAIRPEPAAWVVEKATELGVTAIRFFPSARSQRFHDAVDPKRLRRVAVAALEQCGGATLPLLERCGSFDELVELARARRSVLLDRDGSKELPAFASGPASWLLVVGPEGGLEEHERAALEDAGARRLSLGPRTLRAETAAVAGTAILLQAGGKKTVA